jgi:gluconokinase
MNAGNKGLYVVMGVSGSGKTVIGAGFARALGVDFVEGDEYHSAENVKRMKSGIALTDDDRAEWLRSLAARLREAKEAGTGLVMTCSALKRSYRNILRAESDALRFVFLKGERVLIAERLAARRGHFMPPSLLESQLTTLEAPSPEEDAWVYDIRRAPQEIVDALVARASA